MTINDQGRTRIGNECPSPAYEYDYKHQAWLENGRYIPCGHTTVCSCYGRLHAGEPIAQDAEIR